MHVEKCENGLFKVTLKNISQPFYVENHDLAIEIAMKLGENNA